MTKEDAREALLVSGFNAFLVHGYAGAGISDILSGTELSRGAIYHHFENKLDLFAAVIARYLPFPFDTIDWAAHARLSVAEQHAAIADMYAAAAEAERDFADARDRYYALFFDALSHLPAFRQSISQGYAKIIKALAAAELREGAAPDEATARARRFVAGFEGEIYLRAVIRPGDNERS